MSILRIVPATEADTPMILEMIVGLAAYEKLAHALVAAEGFGMSRPPGKLKKGQYGVPRSFGMSSRHIWHNVLAG